MMKKIKDTAKAPNTNNNNNKNKKKENANGQSNTGSSVAASQKKTAKKAAPETEKLTWNVDKNEEPEHAQVSPRSWGKNRYVEFAEQRASGQRPGIPWSERLTAW